MIWQFSLHLNYCFVSYFKVKVPNFIKVLSYTVNNPEIREAEQIVE